LLVALATGLPLSISVRPASAHPSDFETLTLDLLLGPEGLQAIDAAVVSQPGPSYDPIPSEDDRRAVATTVLQALGIPADDAHIDATMSERYHEVGFTISLDQPFASAGDGSLRFETGPLEGIARDTGLKRLKLAVCDGWPDPLVDVRRETPSRPASFTLRVDARSPGRESDQERQERPGCRVWERIPAADDELSIRARVTPTDRAETSNNLKSIALGALLLTFALGFVVWMRRRSSRTIS
jgi:hypothetical protein